MIKPVSDFNSLTNDQQALVGAINNFFKSKDLSFTISGSAGTGKTFVTKYIINKLLKGKRVAVTAPTHKAVRVIENFTGKAGHTLHSLHGLRPNYSLEEFTIDSIKFEPIGNIKFNEYEIIFIDEASMINKDLKALNDMRSKQYNTKIVYLGDELQLSPVKEDKPSDVFTNVDAKFKLTEIIRQGNTNPLLDLFDILREDVTNDTATFINYIRKNPSNIIDSAGYKLLNPIEFKNMVRDMFSSSDFDKNLNYCRYAAYTNDAVSFWNKYIRTLLNPTKDMLVVGDILTAYKTVVDDNNSPIITNSSDYKVLEVIPRMADAKFACFHVKLLALDNMNTVNISIVNHTDKSFLNYYTILNNLHRKAHYSGGAERGKNFKEYFDFKDLHLCMVNFNLVDKTTNTIRAYVKKELSYGYGVTIHKLQGSTIDNVIMDGLDICYIKGDKTRPRVNTSYTPHAISLRNRLLYTGLSRASNMGYISL